MGGLDGSNGVSVTKTKKRTGTMKNKHVVYPLHLVMLQHINPSDSWPHEHLKLLSHKTLVAVTTRLFYTTNNTVKSPEPLSSKQKPFFTRKGGRAGALRGCIA
jgi:hypothetical protein